MVVTTAAMALVLGAPFINVAVFLGGPRWLAGYAAALALAMVAVAAAVVVTVLLFRTVGPRRTRAMTQILAAVIGAGFAVAVQFAAILSYRDPSEAASRWSVLGRFAAEGDRAGDSVIWLPARAVTGECLPLAILLGFACAALVAAIVMFAPRFGGLALAAGGAVGGTRRGGRGGSWFERPSPVRALRRKEWTLLWRDPWLMSQTLMQLIYLLPAAFLLWRDFYGGSGVATLLVPVLILAAGQLAGGLAWLAVSGEDAPDFIASSPVRAIHVLRARTEAVMGGIAVVFGPFVAVLALVAPVAGLVAMVGIAAAAGSATAIQYWFRVQARRSLFRRRQTSSRIATFAEALSSTMWAGVGALVVAGSWLAFIPAVIAALILGGVWTIRPAREAYSV
jgi:ABC-2 type transport system permease protein